VCLGDGLDDCQPEADARAVGAYAFVATKKWLGKRGDQLGRELLAGVLDRRSTMSGRVLVETQTRT
jgi:hypothetical protein